MNSKKILIFSLFYYPRFVGGAEVAIKEITDRLGQDISFHMITLRMEKNLPRFEKIGNIDVHRIGFTSHSGKEIDSAKISFWLSLNKYLYVPLAFLKALRLHKKNKYSFIWSFMATYNTFSAVFFKLFHPKTPFLFTLQDGDPITHIKRRAIPLYPFFKMMFTRADYIQAISEYLASWARDMGAKCPVKVVPNAVDLSNFSRATNMSPQEIEKKRESLGFKHDDFIILTTSRLVKKNAVEDIITSLTFLPRNVHLLILGTGPLEMTLKKQVSDLGLIDRVKFLGYVPHKDMPEYLAISEVFVRPSLSEGFGNSFIEAMVANVPVVATAVGGITDFLRDGETGLICEVKNPRSIAQKIDKLMKDSESRAFIIREASLLAHNKYGWDNVVREMKEILYSDKLLGYENTYSNRHISS